MRNALSLLLAMLLCVSVFSGCKNKDEGADTSGGDAEISTGDEKAVEDAVENLLENYRKAEDEILKTIFTKVSETMANSDDANISELADSVESLKDVAVSAEDKIMFEKLSYLVNSVDIKDDTAVASVTVYNTDFAALYEQLGSDVLTNMDNISELDDIPMMSKDGEMEFTLKDGKWELSKVDLEFADVITFGMITWMAQSLSSAE